MPSRKQVMIEYLKGKLGQWVHNQELRKVSGLNDTPRTIRLLKQDGWKIDVRGDGYVKLTSLEKGEARGARKSISEKQRYEVFAIDGFKCRACGRGASDGVRLEVDHVVPVDWGGGSELSNYMTLCDECNRGKKAWTKDMPTAAMQQIMSNTSVESRRD
jgi:hypothetical protein